MTNKIKFTKKDIRGLFKEAMFGAFKESIFRLSLILPLSMIMFTLNPFKKISLSVIILYSLCVLIGVILITIITSWWYMWHLVKNDKEIEII